jgi:hypothetical protein
VVAVPSASDKSFSCADTSSTDTVQTSREFPRTATGQVTVSYRFQQSTVGAWTRMFVTSGANSAIQLYDTAGQGLAFLDSAGTYHTLAAISANTWYDVRLVINAGARTFDAYLNNTLVLTGQPYTDPAVTDISAAQFRTGGAPMTTLHIDFLSVKMG